MINAGLIKLGQGEVYRASTFASIRKILIKNKSGLLKTLELYFKPRYNYSEEKLSLSFKINYLTIRSKFSQFLTGINLVNNIMINLNSGMICINESLST